MEKYSRMYSMSQQQHQFIQQLGVASVGRQEWQLYWRRLFREAEIDIAAKFMEDIEGVVMQTNKQDSWCWGVDPSKRYIVGSAYKLLSRHSSNENNDGVFNELWKLKVPSKASHFARRLIRDRLPTKVNLRRRNVNLNGVYCPFCRTSKEDMSHLFFSCDKILWEALSWLNIVGVLVLGGNPCLG